jgi:hypothetical protein
MRSARPVVAVVPESVVQPEPGAARQADSPDPRWLQAQWLIKDNRKEKATKFVLESSQ